MKPFEYVRPSDAATAVAMVGGTPGAAFLGGGTNLVDLMKLGVAGPHLLVDVSRLPHHRIEPVAGGGLRVGASVRNSDLAAHKAVRHGYPVLSQAILAGASGQLRNLATVAGNLMQRTRCGYFTDVTKPCNKRNPGSGCPARTGHHRELAILGASSECAAVHPSDMAVALTALDAVVLTQAPGGARAIPLSALYRLPGDEPHRESVLEHGELIVAIEVPPLAVAERSRYRKVRDRASYAFAVVSAAVALRTVDGTVADVRLALGGVAPVPWRARRAEDALRGAPATAAAFARAVDEELAEAQTLPGNAFKVDLARRLVVRMLLEQVDGAAA